MDQFFYWSGVVLWCTSGLFMLIALTQWAGMNFPGELRGENWTIYKFGIGEVAIIKSDSMMSTMRKAGYRIHDGDGFWWCAKVFRVMI